MVKLFTDEEMDEKCKDYDPIPMKVAQDILHRNERDDRVNILNGVIKSPYRIGQPPANVNMYANGVQKLTGGRIRAELFIQEYNKVVDAKIVEKEKEIEQGIDAETQTDPEPKRVRRTKREVEESRQMGNEDVDAVDPKEPDTLEA